MEVRGGGERRRERRGLVRQELLLSPCGGSSLPKAEDWAQITDVEAKLSKRVVFQGPDNETVIWESLPKGEDWALLFLSGKIGTKS